MRSKINFNNSQRNKRVGLYSFVFASRVSLITVFFLFVSFVVQPVHLALANEAAADELPPEPPSLADVVFEEMPEETVELEPEEIVDAVKELPVTATDVALAEDADLTDTEIDEEIIIEDVEFPDTLPTEGSDDSAYITKSTNEESLTSITPTDPTEEFPDDASTSTTKIDSVDVIDDVSTSTLTTAVEGVTSTTTATATATATTTKTATTTTTEISSSDAGGSNSGTSPTSTTETDDSEPVTTEKESVSKDVVPDVLSSTTVDVSPVLPDTSAEPTTADEISTSTEQTSVTRAESLVTDDNYYQFDKQACVSAGDGTYYCSVSEGEVVDSNAVVYSEIGPSGSPEIFIKTTEGEVVQITDNNFEDSAPHYDALSQKIAWQRLIQGRYQIIIYDIETAEEKQLTFSRTNNMEPAASVEGVVWQAWDNNDWEVMYYDGTYTDQLTNNDTQDVAPVMQEEYIIWTIIGGGEQFAQVYSLETKEIVTISNSGGGSILNPRFVLVYDTQFDNGDVITQRFDPDTGFAEAIAAQPAQAPLKIPEPDTAGEIKALITTKSTSKQTQIVHGDNADGTVTGPSATTTSGTLILGDDATPQVNDGISTSTDGTLDTAHEGENQPFELTEYDLILPPTPSTTASVQVSTSTKTEA
jgi:hypothetical protein